MPDFKMSKLEYFQRWQLLPWEGSDEEVQRSREVPGREHQETMPNETVFLPLKTLSLSESYDKESGNYSGMQSTR